MGRCFLACALVRQPPLADQKERNDVLARSPEVGLSKAPVAAIINEAGDRD